MIKGPRGYPNDIPLNIQEKSIFFLNEVQKTLKKSINLSGYNTLE
jgi:hypothetical protein